MSDLALTWDASAYAADLSLASNDLVGEDGLRTAVLRSLFEDREAEPGDVLPEGETYRRGWWADSFPAVEGDKAGSRLWLLARAKQEPATLDRAEEYAREAVQWLLDDKIASALTVTAEFIGSRGLGLTVAIHRPTGDVASFRFGRAWTAEET